MSKFEDQIDSNDAICPYCIHRYQVESEDYDEDQREEYCENCGKSYWLSQSFTVTHETCPDCSLNGMEHHFEEKPLSNGKKAKFCTECGIRDMQAYIVVRPND